MIKKGIDVSKWQGIIDWNKVKNSGIEFAIIRIGFGKFINQKDTCFERNYREARNNGIPIGVYHYSYATSVEEAKEEAKCVVRWLNGRKLDLPVYFDIEDKSQSSLNKNILNSMCEAFCNIIEKAGYWAGIYSNKFWATSIIDGAKLGSRYTYWIAQYNNECTYKGNYDIWQYSSSGSVDGIIGNVDMNYMNRDLISEINNPNDKSNIENNNKENNILDLSNYNGKSIVDGLKSIGVDSSFENRSIIYRNMGFIDEYIGSSIQNINLLNRLKHKAINTFYPKYNGNSDSIVDALKSLNVDSSINNRKIIAKINNIDNYTGTAIQNIQLLRLLKNGQLKKE